MGADPGLGALELISSRRNPLVGQLRALHQGRGRRDQQRLLLEGTHLLQEVLRLGLRPDWLLASAAWLDGHAQLLTQLRQGADPAGASTLQLRVVSEEVLGAVATTAHPDGVVLTLPLNQLPQPRAWPAGDGQPGDRPGTRTQAARVAGLVLALDRLQDPGNLGTLLRCALAAGVEEVWLAGGADPHQPKVLRASAGAALALPLRRLPDLAPALYQATGEGCQVVATVVPPPGERSGAGSGGTSGQPAAVRPYWQLDWGLPTVLLLGNEGAGLDPALIALASERVTIPHSPAVESLNVALAAAPLLLERWRQRLGG